MNDNVNLSVFRDVSLSRIPECNRGLMKLYLDTKWYATMHWHRWISMATMIGRRANGRLAPTDKSRDPLTKCTTNCRILKCEVIPFFFTSFVCLWLQLMAQPDVTEYRCISYLSAFVYPFTLDADSLYSGYCDVCVRDPTVPYVVTHIIGVNLLFLARFQSLVIISPRSNVT